MRELCHLIHFNMGGGGESTEKSVFRLNQLCKNSDLYTACVLAALQS